MAILLNLAPLHPLVVAAALYLDQQAPAALEVALVTHREVVLLVLETHQLYHRLKEIMVALEIVMHQLIPMGVVAAVLVLLAQPQLQVGVEMVVMGLHL